MIQYNMNWCELKVKANIVKINHETAIRNEGDNRRAVLGLYKQNLEGKMFYCIRRKMNVLVVLVEANKNILFIREKLICCNIAWAIGKAHKKNACFSNLYHL